MKLNNDKKILGNPFRILNPERVDGVQKLL